MKEAREESGLKNIVLLSDKIFDVGIHPIPEYKGISEHYRYDVKFLLIASDKNEIIRVSDESVDLQWFETPPSDNPEINRMFEKWSNQ